MARSCTSTDIAVVISFPNVSRIFTRSLGQLKTARGSAPTPPKNGVVARKKL